VISGDKRLILYNMDFVHGSPRGAKDTRVLAMFAHAVAHHMKGHLFADELSDEQVLESDEYAGFVVAQTSDADGALLMIRSEQLLVATPASATADRRSAAMQAGWQRARRALTVSVIAKPQPVPQKAAPSVSYSSIDIPIFPWPPPRASARTKIPLDIDERSSAKLQDVARVLEGAFQSAGYGDSSYFAIPEGFAMVSRLEQINADGTPKGDPDRWSTRVRPFTKFTLSAYVRALFVATPGHFRVVVFVVTPVPFNQSNRTVASTEATAWLMEGLDALPSSIGNVKVTVETKLTALIYEFVRQTLDDPVDLQLPSALLGATHLQRSKLAQRLKFSE
jgi:hypothetical protein